MKNIFSRFKRSKQRDNLKIRDAVNKHASRLSSQFNVVMTVIGTFMLIDGVKQAIPQIGAVGEVILGGFIVLWWGRK